MNPTVLRPVKELKGFKKVVLQPGESRRVTLELDQLPSLTSIRTLRSGTLGQTLVASWSGLHLRIFGALHNKQMRWLYQMH